MWPELLPRKDGSFTVEMKRTERPLPPDVQGWIDKAEGDLRAARLLAGAAPPEPDAAAFHSQQASEKYLKAFLVFLRVDPPRTHNLLSLLDLLARYDGSFESLRDAAGSLNPLAVRIRYPFARATAEEAADALAHAETICDAVRARLSE